MGIMMKKLKNRLDEMQEQKLLKIEHNGCWLAFWGLFAVVVVQTCIYGIGEWEYIVGEWLVFMCLALYIVIDCIRNGIWDRKLPPTPAVNVGTSLIAGIFVAIINFILSYKRYNKLWGAAAAGVFMGALAFFACLMLLTGLTFLYKRRMNNLEKENEEKEEN